MNPGQRRSASAIADGRSSGCPFGWGDIRQNRRFLALLLWRNVAREIAGRLRERNRFVSTMNPRPVLFVGCSTEALSLGRAIQSTLDHDPMTVKVWTDGIFSPSSFPVESLERELHSVDFAAIVLSPDDTIVSREGTSHAPRDNLIFELGLFIGALGRKRTFLVCPRGVDIKIPTDLIGVTPLTYKPEPEFDASISVAAACNEMREIIRKAGPR